MTLKLIKGGAEAKPDPFKKFFKPGKLCPTCGGRIKLCIPQGAAAPGYAAAVAKYGVDGVTQDEAFAPSHNNSNGRWYCSLKCDVEGGDGL